MNAVAKIYDINEPFPFDKLTLMKPFNRNGSYFMRIEIDGNGQPLFIQPPRCELKQGFIKSGKKTLCDFIFSTENEKFLEWLERLEERCYLQVYENREKWFDPILEKHEIEDYMTSPYKMYKSGKYYIIRTDIPTNLGKCEIKIYDENEKEIDPDTLNEHMNAITIIEFKGIRCSVRSFQFEIELKQMLIVEPKRMFNTLLIKGSSPHLNSSSTCTQREQPIQRIKRTSEDDERKRLYREKIRQRIQEKQEAGEHNNKNEIQSPVLENLIVSLNQPPEHLEHPDPTQQLFSNNSLTSNEQIYSNLEQKEQIQERIESMNSSEPIEFEIDLAKLNEINDEPVHLKNKNDIYYEKYKEAKKKAKEAKIIALTNYLEAKRIKSTYLEEMDMTDSDSDLADESNDIAENIVEKDEINKLTEMLDIQEL